MKKTLLALIFALSLGINLFAAPEVKQIGGTDYKTSDGTAPAPINAYENYGLCQVLYIATDIGEVENANITKLAFYYKANSRQDRNVDIYISHSNLAKLTGFVNVAAVNKVYSGSSSKKITMPSSAGWYEITLDSPFAWDGTSNILITIDDNSNTFVNNSNTDHYAGFYNALTNRVACAYNHSGTNYNPITATSYSATLGKHYPSIKLTFEASTTVPDVPSNLAVSATTTTSATLSWSAVSGATSYDFQQSANGSDWSDLASGATGTSYNWTGLSVASTQYARIRATNAAGSSDWSDAVTVTTDAIHEHDGITFNKWTSTNSLPSSGNYYLNENVELGYVGPDLTLSGDLNLCLNGKIANLGIYKIIVPDGKKLTVFDNVGGGKITSIVPSEVGAADIYAKALIVVYSGGELVLKQGTIENNFEHDPTDPEDDYSSYAIYSNGTLHLSGDVLINSNDADIYLYSTNVITLDGAISNAEKHTVYKAGGDFTSGWSTYMSGENPRDYFTSANSARSVCLNAGEASLRLLLNLSESSLNSSIGTSSGQVADVNLTRSLTSSQYNTFCLPFALSNAQLQAAFGSSYDLEEFDGASLDGDQLSLTFNKVTSLTAGKPYLLQPSVDVVNPSFEGVTIGVTAPADQTSDTYISFHGTFAPTELQGGNKNLLFLGADNELFWPDSDGDLKGFRAYFEVKGGAAKVAKRARIVNKEDSATGIENMNQASENQKFILNGQLYIRHNGAIYNIQGQRL